MTYGAPVDLKLKSGHMTVNLTAVGLGRINYRDVELSKVES